MNIATIISRTHDANHALRWLRGTGYRRVRRVAAAVLIAIIGIASAQAQSCFNPQVTPSTPTSDFTLHTDGTVTHLPSGLQWMRCSLGQTWSGTSCAGNAQSIPLWRDALQLVRAVNSGASNADGDGMPGFAGFMDWRLPNIKELTSIHEACRRFPAVNNVVFPNAPASGLHWPSSTPHTQPNVAWYFDFGTGTVSFADKSGTAQRFAKLVRAGAGASGYLAGSNRVFADGFEAVAPARPE
jgi:hypothetical protein